jgi:putative FmdB family regulatory protein
MPTYDYRCKACDHRLELFQNMSEAPKRKCPECGKLTLERLIGAGAGILFKGKGFYQTDYRSESYKEAAKKEQGETKSESKPETKVEGETKSKSDSKKPSAKPKKPE